LDPDVRRQRDLGGFARWLLIDHRELPRPWPLTRDAVRSVFAVAAVLTAIVLVVTIALEVPRRDLHRACAQAGVENCSPNDLRRTYAKWMRLARVPAEIVAPTMGHRDTRMVERVYGRLSPEEIGVLLSAHFADCMTGVADKVDSGGKSGRIGLSRGAKGLKSVPRGGIEPPTRGFSVPVADWPTPRSSKRKRLS
jgi:hypothetical protein